MLIPARNLDKLQTFAMPSTRARFGNNRRRTPPACRVDSSSNTQTGKTLPNETPHAQKQLCDRAKREAELVEKGASASEAAIKADKELAAKEESQQQELAVSLAAQK